MIKLLWTGLPLDLDSALESSSHSVLELSDSGDDLQEELNERGGHSVVLRQLGELYMQLD